MRAGLKTLLIIIAVIVVVTVAMTMTPLGWSLARSFIERQIVGDSDLALTIGSLRGNLLTHATLESITLTAPDVGVILSVDELALEYSLPALVGGRTVSSDISIADAHFLVEMGEDGRPAGWSMLARGEEREDDEGMGLGISINIEASDLSGMIVSEARGYDINLRGVDADAGIEMGPSSTADSSVEIGSAATADAEALEHFEMALVGSTSLVLPTMLSPVDAVLSCVISGDRSSVVAELDLESAAIAIGASGGVRVGDSMLEGIAIESSAELETLALILGWENMSGGVHITGSIDGPFGSPAWEAKLTSGGAVVHGVEIERLDSWLLGEERSIEIERISASAFGGEIEGTLALTMPGPSADGLWIDAHIEATGIDLKNASDHLLPQTILGLASIDERLAMNPSDLATISGDFDCGVIGLKVRDTDLGDIDLSGDASGGEFTLWGNCCDASLTAAGGLSARGVSAADLTVEVSDLAMTAAEFGTSDIMGAATGSVHLDGLGDTLRYEGTIDLRGIETPRLVVGDGHTAFSGDLARAEAEFDVLGGTLVGDASLVFGEAYRVACAFDSMSLSGDVVAGSAGVLDLSGRITGTAVITGDLVASGRGGTRDGSTGTGADADSRAARRAAFTVNGGVEALSLSVSDEDIELTSPMTFAARPGSLFITETQFVGDFGRLSLGGVFDSDGESLLTGGLDSLNIAAAMRLASEGASLPDVRGIATGQVVIEGRADDLGASADLRLEDLIVEGLFLGSVSLDAETASDDLLFDVEARSPFGGKIAANGSFPYVDVPGGSITLDPSREFAVTAVCSSYALEGGVAFVPTLRGRKRLKASGSLLLVGRADSVSSLNGAGRFDELSATLDVVTFSLVDTFEFTVAGGDLDLHDLDVEITRLRAIGREVGGRIDVFGGVGSSGDIRLSARTFGLKVGHVSRAFLPGRQAPVLGDLDLVAGITGSIDNPTVEFAWELSSPRIYGFGFDGFRGNASLTREYADLGHAELTAGDETITFGGRVPLGQGGARPGFEPAPSGLDEPTVQEEPAALDAWIAADGFDLGAIGPLPEGMTEFEGDLNIDMRLTGSAESPVPTGSLMVSACEIDGYDLKDPLHDIELRMTAAEGMAVLERASVGLGSGSVTATGFIATGVSDVPHFMIDLDISGAEVGIEEMMDARFGGGLRWVGTTKGSALSGEIDVERMELTPRLELSQLVTRRPRRVSMVSTDDPRASVRLDVDFVISDPIRILGDQVRTEFTGGFHVGGSALVPAPSGGVSAPGGTFRYMRNTFSVERLDLVYADPRRRDPYLGLTGNAIVESRSGVSYDVTLSFDGFLSETMPVLASSPPLSEPDIAALLTIGETVGVMAGGGLSGDSASDSFSSLARSAFVSSLFGIAESTVERWLHLDTVTVDREALDDGDLAGAEVSLGKRIGGAFRIDYATELGQFAGQSVSASLELSDGVSLVTRASQEGNHAIGLKFHFKFR